MKSRNKLRRTQIYTDNDFTKEKMHVQARLRKIAKEGKRKGLQAIVKYGSIIIDRTRWQWVKIGKTIIKTRNNNTRIDKFDQE